MSVDLIKAIEAREAEQPSRESGKGESEFPNVLRSSLERDEGADSDASRETTSGRESERAAESRENSARSDEQAARDGSESKGDERSQARDGAEQAKDAEASEESEAVGVAEAAAAAGAASVLLERARAALGLEAEVEEEGRLTALDEESADGRLAPGAENRAVESEVELEAELEGSRGAMAREVIDAARTLEADSREIARVGADAEASAASTAVATDAAVAANSDGQSELREPGAAIVAEAADPADTATDRENETGTAREDVSPDRQEPSQAAYDQALAGAQAEGIDPNLRQAIVNRDEASRAPETVAVAGAAAVANPVAGAVIETPTAVPGEPAPAPASDAISVQTEWLATRGGGTARLVLHPPELGELTIRVTLRGGNVDVVMVAQQAVAHSIAEEQSDRLAQAFASRDLRMDQFEVRRGDPNDFADLGFGQFDGSGAEREGQTDEQETAGSGGGPETPRGLLGRRETGIETPPQIVSAGPEASVDLRA